MRNEFYNLVNELNNMFYNDGGYKSFPMDVVEIENGFEVYAEIPGVTKDQISLTFEKGDLIIEASPIALKDKKYLIHERNALKFKRTVSFGDIDEDSMHAKYENGILVVTILTKAPEVKKAKTINIE